MKIKVIADFDFSGGETDFVMRLIYAFVTLSSNTVRGIMRSILRVIKALGGLAPLAALTPEDILEKRTRKKCRRFLLLTDIQARQACLPCLGAQSEGGGCPLRFAQQMLRQIGQIIKMMQHCIGA